jgi:hypothetical protein
VTTLSEETQASPPDPGAGLRRPSGAQSLTLRRDNVFASDTETFAERDSYLNSQFDGTAGQPGKPPASDLLTVARTGRRPLAKAPPSC